MYAIDFEFDGKRLSDFGCILTTFDGLQNGAVPSGASTVFATGSALGSDRFDVYGSSYSEPFSATFYIVKNPCDVLNMDNMSFTPREISSIQRWLCRRGEYRKFKLLEDGYEDIYWNGYFTSQQHVLGSAIVGLSLVFTADSPYAYLEDITLHYTPTANTAFLIDSKSDEEGYIYPDITITFSSAGDFKLRNDRDTKITSIDNCTSGEIITINGKNMIISTNKESHVLADDFNFVFPRIINTYDNTENNFISNMACTIDITYPPAIKVGF